MRFILVPLMVALNVPVTAMQYGWNRTQSPIRTNAERLLAYKENRRQKYYPLVLAAQNPEGREIAFDYFYGQLMERPLPNGIPFEQAYIYWGEHRKNPDDPVIPAIKDYVQQVLTLVFALRKHGLKTKETRWELFKAVDAINWEMNIKEKDKWQEVKTAIDQFNIFRRQRDISRTNE